MLWSQEAAKKVLNRLVERPSVTGAARMLGASSKLIWIWCRNSARDKANNVVDSKYRISGWPSDDPDDNAEEMFFHDAVSLSRMMHALNSDSDARELLAGQSRTIIEGGKVMWRVSPTRAAEALTYPESDDLFQLVYGRPRSDVYERDENGALIPLEVKDPIPAALKIHLMKVLLPNLHNIPEKREISSQVQQSVLVLRGDQPSLETKLAAIRANNSVTTPPSYARPERK